MRATRLLLLSLPLLVAACGDATDDASDGSAAAGDAAATRVRRVDSAEARELRELVDLGHYEEGQWLLGTIAGTLGPEADLIRARLHALAGEEAEMVRAVERARAQDPSDPRVFATMIELNAVAGRLDTARAELERGLAACGSTPELLRATGVMQLSQSGGARRGVATIESALRRDADLPFTSRALAQGHLLLAKEALAAARPTAALESVKRSLSYDPEEVEARRVLADVLVSALRFEEAILILDELIEQGEPLEGEVAVLHKKAGIAGLIPTPGESAEDREARRARALDHLVEARRLGLTDDELASGAMILAEEAGVLADQGADAYAELDFETARERFERALRYDPDHLAARNHLAVTLYQLGDYAGAAHQWREVMIVMEREELIPPEPIHLNLARALVQDGDELGARGTLERWLERNADNEAYAEYTALTRDLLAALESD